MTIFLNYFQNRKIPKYLCKWQKIHILAFSGVELHVHCLQFVFWPVYNFDCQFQIKDIQDKRYALLKQQLCYKKQPIFNNSRNNMINFQASQLLNCTAGETHHCCISVLLYFCTIPLSIFKTDFLSSYLFNFRITGVMYFNQGRINHSVKRALTPQLFLALCAHFCVCKKYSTELILKNFY